MQTQTEGRGKAWSDRSQTRRDLRRQRAKAPKHAHVPASPAPEEPKAKGLVDIVVRDVMAKNTPTPRDNRIPLAEIDGLLVKTIHVIGDGELSRMEITQRGGASTSTLRNWQLQRVRRPLVSTLRATLAACGYELAILDPQGNKL